MFRYLIAIEPLGLLYGSSGRFLSPENLVGRSGTSFPPSAATLSGLFAAVYGKDAMKRDDFFVAGPFWANRETPKNFYVPTPFNCLVKDNEIQYTMAWHQNRWCVWQGGQCHTSPNDKFEKGTWLAIDDWQKLSNHQTAKELAVHTKPWKFLPHLHPQLKEDERCVNTDEERGSLFLENGVQLQPDICLIYLSNTPIHDGWYRFGGEGHMVNLQCIPIDSTDKIHQLLNQSLDRSFALITPAVWGSNRLSYREPGIQQNDGWQPVWQTISLLTERPISYRYRLGGGENELKRLSRGRYAVPAGSVYVLEKPLDEKHDRWEKWHESWFPKEGPSLKRWGCGLALPLPGALAQSSTQNSSAQTSMDLAATTSA
jgi:CRISPR-associated protein Cmr3